MSKIVRKQESVLFEGIRISDFLDKKFLEKLKKEELELLPVSLVFIATEKEENKKTPYPIIIGHENPDEVKNKIMHINTPSTELSDKFIKMLEEMG